MPTIIQTTNFLAALAPVVLFISVAVATFLFVKYKGTMDALRDTADTYRELAEAKEKSIEELTKKLEACEAEIRQLKEEVQRERAALRITIDEFRMAFEGRGTS